jgi:hypothetical protein
LENVPHGADAFLPAANEYTRLQTRPNVAAIKRNTSYDGLPRPLPQHMPSTVSLGSFRNLSLLVSTRRPWFCASIGSWLGHSKNIDCNARYMLTALIRGYIFLLEPRAFTLVARLSNSVVYVPNKFLGSPHPRGGDSIRVNKSSGLPSRRPLGTRSCWRQLYSTDLQKKKLTAGSVRYSHNPWTNRTAV